MEKDLVSTKHELLRIKEMLEMAEKVWEIPVIWILEYLIKVQNLWFSCIKIDEVWYAFYPEICVLLGARKES